MISELRSRGRTISDQPSTEQAKPPFVPRTIRRFAVPVILLWLLIVFLVSVAVPPLEQVAEQRQVSLSPKEAPSVIAMQRMGSNFKESDSDSFAMLVMEGLAGELGDEAHTYYDGLIRAPEERYETCPARTGSSGVIDSPRPARRVKTARLSTSN